MSFEIQNMMMWKFLCNFLCIIICFVSLCYCTTFDYDIMTVDYLINQHYSDLFSSFIIRRQLQWMGGETTTGGQASHK